MKADLRKGELSRIELDKHFDIRLHYSGTYDLYEWRKTIAERGKNKGQEIIVETCHGYHSSIFNALKKYAQVAASSEKEKFELEEYVEMYISKLDYALNKAKEWDKNR